MVIDRALMLAAEKPAIIGLQEAGSWGVRKPSIFVKGDRTRKGFRMYRGFRGLSFLLSSAVEKEKVTDFYMSNYSSVALTKS